ncbi:MAG: hypothetical protein FJ220_05925 [Kiritimatiellaceae bacterium]|nr:hypothetical protein [Kiritimatiellaceae bacterium]
MQAWWNQLALVSQIFYGLALFFSVFFLWQMIAGFMGLDGDAASDVSDGGGAAGLDHHDVVEASQAFKILSLRSIITFFTLFFWGSALYTTGGMFIGKSMGISFLWGLAGMPPMAGIFYGMGKLTESGTKNVQSCKGCSGTVYLNIPENGAGEIKVTINGVSEHVGAVSAGGEALSAGTSVRVVEVVDQTLVKVERIVK